MSHVYRNPSYDQARTDIAHKMVQNFPGKTAKGMMSYPKVAFLSDRSASTDTVTTEMPEPFNKWSNIDESPHASGKKMLTETITPKQGKQLGRQWRSSATMMTADLDHVKQKEIAIMAKKIVSRRRGSDDTVDDDIDAQIKAEMEEERAAALKKQYERETSFPSTISYQRAQPDMYVGWAQISEADPIVKPIKHLAGYVFKRTVRKMRKDKTGFVPAVWEYRNRKGEKFYVRAVGIQEAVCRDADNWMVAPVVQHLRDGANGWPQLVAEFTAGSTTYIVVPKMKKVDGPWFM